MLLKDKTLNKSKTQIILNKSRVNKVCAKSVKQYNCLKEAIGPIV